VRCIYYDIVGYEHGWTFCFHGQAIVRAAGNQPARRRSLTNVRDMLDHSVVTARTSAVQAGAAAIPGLQRTRAPLRRRRRVRRPRLRTTERSAHRSPHRRGDAERLYARAPRKGPCTSRSINTNQPVGAGARAG
jgi:hypothetical protein